MSGEYGWSEGAFERKARLARERAAKEAAEREAAEWKSQGYVEIKPTKLPRMSADDVAIGDVLANDHVRLRDILEDIEELATMPGWSEKDGKRLDKAIVLAKVGAKTIAKVLKARGYAKARSKASVSAPNPQRQEAGE